MREENVGVSKDSLAHVVLNGGVVIELLQRRESGSPVILGATTALFITEVLSGIWGEETFVNAGVSQRYLGT
jgi:hypothetical protein